MESCDHNFLYFRYPPLIQLTYSFIYHIVNPLDPINHNGNAMHIKKILHKKLSHPLPACRIDNLPTHIFLFRTRTNPHCHRHSLKSIRRRYNPCYHARENKPQPVCRDRPIYSTENLHELLACTVSLAGSDYDIH